MPPQITREFGGISFAALNQNRKHPAAKRKRNDHTHCPTKILLTKCNFLIPVTDADDLLNYLRGAKKSLRFEWNHDDPEGQGVTEFRIYTSVVSGVQGKWTSFGGWSFIRILSNDRVSRDET